MKKLYAKWLLVLLIIQIPVGYLPGMLIKDTQKLEMAPISSRQSGTLYFNATKAYNHIVTQLNFGFRVPGSVPHSDCAAWINQSLQNITESVIIQDFTVQKTGQPAYQCQNVLGKINTNKTGIVILGAHWDSRAVAEKDSVDKFNPIPGANDGASGAAVLLELARILNQSKSELNAQVWVLFLDAEDQGNSLGVYGIEGWEWCEGAQAFNNVLNTFYNPINESIQCFILLDMVGGTNLIFVDEAHSTNTLQDAIFLEGRALGYGQQFPVTPKSMVIADDHVEFLENNIASVDLIIDFSSGPWSHHHKHSDDLLNIDIDSLNITGRTVESFVKTYYKGSILPDWGDPWNNDLWLQWFWPLIILSGLGVVAVVLILYSKKKLKFDMVNLLGVFMKKGGF